MRGRRTRRQSHAMSCTSFGIVSRSLNSPSSHRLAGIGHAPVGSRPRKLELASLVAVACLSLAARPSLYVPCLRSKLDTCSLLGFCFMTWCVMSFSYSRRPQDAPRVVQQASLGDDLRLVLKPVLEGLGHVRPDEVIVSFVSRLMSGYSRSTRVLSCERVHFHPCACPGHARRWIRLLFISVVRPARSLVMFVPVVSVAHCCGT